MIVDEFFGPHGMMALYDYLSLGGCRTCNVPCNVTEVMPKTGE